MDSAKTIEKVANTISNQIGNAVEITKPMPAFIVQEWQRTGVLHIVFGIICISLAIILALATKKLYIKYKNSDDDFNALCSFILFGTGSFCSTLVSILLIGTGIERIIAPHATLLKEIIGK